MTPGSAYWDLLISQNVSLLTAIMQLLVVSHMISERPRPQSCTKANADDSSCSRIISPARSLVLPSFLGESTIFLWSLLLPLVNRASVDSLDTLGKRDRCFIASVLCSRLAACNKKTAGSRGGSFFLLFTSSQVDHLFKAGLLNSGQMSGSTHYSLFDRQVTWPLGFFGGPSWISLPSF